MPLCLNFAAPTAGEVLFPIAAAADVCRRNTTTSFMAIDSCQHKELFIPSLVQGKIIICTYTFDFEFEAASIAAVADTVRGLGAAGFIITMDPDLGSEQVKGTTMTIPVPGIVLNNMEASSVWHIWLKVFVTKLPFAPPKLSSL